MGENKNARHLSFHGMSRSRIYMIWAGMKSRCNYPKNISYKNYGGRGITVCDEWSESFEEFYKWAMKNGYSENAETRTCSLDRIDNDKGYSPDNCRFVTPKQQANNRRKTRLIEHNGVVLCISDWAKRYGRNESTFKGMDDNKIKRVLEIYDNYMIAHNVSVLPKRMCSKYSQYERRADDTGTDNP